MSETPQTLTILQVVFGGVFVILGMILISPWVMYSGNTIILSIAIALVCMSNGLTQLVAAFMEIIGKKD